MFADTKATLASFVTPNRLPFRATIEHRQNGEWVFDASGFSIEFLAAFYTDMQMVYPEVRIVNRETGDVLCGG